MQYYIEISDKRNRYLYEIMKESGEIVEELNLPIEKCTYKEASFIFSPTRKLSEDEVKAFPVNIAVFASNIGGEIKSIFDEKNIRYINYMENESFAIKNAELTAEGILALLIEKTDTSIYDNKILILGEGRCGKKAAELLERLELSFLIAKRNVKSSRIGEHVDIVSDGYIDIHSELEEEIGKFDVIINTIPAKTIEGEMVAKIKKSALFLEIASQPSIDEAGVEFKFYKAGGLPQVYSPKSAARLIYQLIKSNI